MNEDIKGLRERIAIAGSPEEINRLLEEGSTYTDASDRTRAAWNHTAQRRRVELGTRQVSGEIRDCRLRVGCPASKGAQ
jgi:hypothetical protein